MAATEKLAIINGVFCLPEEGRITVRRGNLTIEQGIVTGITESAGVNTAPAAYEGYSVIDAGGRVVTLPNINFHDHFYSRLCKGFSIAGSTEDFPLILENLWWKLDSLLDTDMVKACAEMSALEAIRCGVTTIFDHHSSPFAADNSLGIIAKALQSYHLRSVLCFEVTDRNGKAHTEAGLTETVRFIAENCTADTRALLGLHASFTVDDDTLHAARRLQEQHGIGVHIHLCEDVSDRRLSLERYGMAPVERLYRYGLLQNNSLLAHAIHITDAERRIIAETGTSVVYNLDSNLNNSVGLPQPELMPAGVKLLMGTDGMHANPVHTLKQLFLLQRNRGATFGEAFGLVQKSYFDGIAFAREFFPDFSLLNTGDRGDLIIWDYLPPAPLTAENFWGHYLYGIADRAVHSVVQGGNVLMQEFRFTFTDTASHRFIAEQGGRLKTAFESIIK